MPDLDEKLKRFTEAIMADAAADSQAILDEVRRQREASMASAEDDALGDSYTYIKNAVARIRTENGRRVSRKQMENKRLLYARRAELSEGVLRGVLEKLAAYVKEPAYVEQLTGMAREAAGAFGGARVVVGLRREDMALVPQLRQAVRGSEVAFVEGAVKLGGLTAECPARRQSVVRTFDDSFAGWKERFFAEIAIPRNP